MSWGRLIAAAVLGLLIFWRATAEPAPVAADADLRLFASGRAMADIRRIAAEPHPTGSPANRRARDYLLQRMAALGLEPRVQRELSVAARDGGALVTAATVENLIGVLPGRDRAAPAMALVAHYDSVPGSPGAGDDAAGVASVLETVRALKLRGPPARDVVVVITDAEEAGLLGAEAFYARDPLARHIGTVINLEARGGGGRAVMFETSADNGDLIRALRRTAAGPTANSLANFVYEHMPNDTDLTPAKRAGKLGINLAFAGRQFDYHSPTATVANLSEGSVQSMGQQTLALAAELAFAPRPPARADDLVFADVLGAGILAYPPWAGWLAIAAAAGLTALAWRRSREPIRPFGVGLGVLAGPFILLAANAVLWLAREGTGAGGGFLAQRALVARFGLWETALALACAGVTLLAVRLFGRGRRQASTWLGLLLFALAVAVALQVAVPMGAHILAWPLVVSAASAATSGLGTGRGWASRAAPVLAAAVSLGWIGSIFHLIALGLDAPAALSPFPWLACLALWPLIESRNARRRRWLPAVMVLALAAGLVAVIRLSSPWSERHPQPTLAWYVADLSEKRFWRAAVAVGPSAWADGFLRRDGAVPVRRALPPLLGAGQVAPARPVAVSDPGVALSQGPDGLVSLALPGRADARSLTVEIRSSAPIADAGLDGRPVTAMSTPGEWTILAIRPSETPLTFSFRPRGAARIDVRYALVLDRWPADAPPLPARPAGVAAWRDSDALALLGEVGLSTQ